MRTRHILTAILSLTALSACSATPPTANSNKYRQTWATPYSRTTCAEYLNQMTGKQRWVMAADLLTSFRKVDGGTTLPSDSGVSRFEANVATTCRSQSSLKATELAVVIYKADSSYQP